MSKAFWQGFDKASAIGITLGIVFISGLALGSYAHPYEKCKRSYSTQENITECVWAIDKK
jgi:hypothetical protein